LTAPYVNVTLSGHRVVINLRRSIIWTPLLYVAACAAVTVVYVRCGVTVVTLLAVQDPAMWNAEIIDILTS